MCSFCVRARSPFDGERSLELLGPQQGGDHVDGDRQTAGRVEQDHQHGQARLSSAA
jgi:hypothetical protein